MVVEYAIYVSWHVLEMLAQTGLKKTGIENVH
jgi:hypothetical protein